MTGYERDAELNVTRITLPNGGVVRNTFDGEGRLTSTTDPLGNRRPTSSTPSADASKTTDARDNATKTRYDANGRVVAEEDPTGATEYVRDANGRPVRATDPAGGRTASLGIRSGAA